MTRAVLPAIGLLCAAAVGAAEPPGRILKAPLGSSAPLMYRDASGRPTGFAVDALNEAGRRENVKIEWVQPGADDAATALQRGDIDILAYGIESPERRRLFYVSEPWWTAALIALAPRDGPVRSAVDLERSRLSVPLAASPVVERRYPSSSILVRRSAIEALEAACTGDADAALIPGMYVRELFEHPSSTCRSISLRTIDSEARLEYVIVARPEAADVARALRRRLDEITMDGTLASIAAHYPLVSTLNATRMGELLRLRYERRNLRTAMLAAVSLIGVALFFIFRLQRSRARLRAANASLESANRDKSLLLREVQHRVKNNLQVISSLVSLQTAYAGGGGGSATSSDLQGRIRSMAMVHEKLSFSGVLAEIDFGEYVRELADHLRHSYGVDSSRVRVRLDADATLRLDEAAPCGLIAHELLSNAFKHAFPASRAGDVRLSLRADGDEYVLEVKDNGVGLPPGFRIENCHSLGLQVVSDLVEQLGGTLEVTGEGGATFRIRFKRAQV